MLADRGESLCLGTFISRPVLFDGWVFWESLSLDIVFGLESMNATVMVKNSSWEVSEKALVSAILAFDGPYESGYCLLLGNIHFFLLPVLERLQRCRYLVEISKFLKIFGLIESEFLMKFLRK